MRAFAWLCGLAAWFVASMFLWSTAGAMITSPSTVGVLLGILMVAVLLGGVGLIALHIWRAIGEL